MIGVLSRREEQDVVREFFELFKTPWEFAKIGRRYEVLICTRDEPCEDKADLVLLYSSERISFDKLNCVPVTCCREGATVLYARRRLPLYGRVSIFPDNQLSLPRLENHQESLTFLSRAEKSVVVRVGYDLFAEIRSLLTVGQPVINAGIPTLELHISLLRELIIRSGISLVEIPPVPEGHEFIACLTHDVDHPVLRNHCLDHTMYGFLYRATAGSVTEVCRGRKSLKSLGQNWWTACKLPLVHLGMAKDPWRGFDRYMQIEAGLGSTFFVIPKKEYAGRQTDGQAPRKRAASYDISEIKPELERIMSRGCEVALHGIDAWLDSCQGEQERDTLSATLGVKETGVRMHWLFFNEKTYGELDRAGFLYDSTFGYNETVGYRAGTAQAYKPPGAANLLELPLHVMDTALFYPGYLNSSEADARRVVWQLLDDAAQFGGALTINWHDRSIAPERLWGEFYLNLLRELRRRRAWCPTAAQAVSWFRKRRSVTFDDIKWGDGTVTLKVVSAIRESATPGLKVRVYCAKEQNLSQKRWEASFVPHIDLSFKTELATSVAMPAN